MRYAFLASALICAGAAVAMALHDERIAAVFFILATANFVVGYYDHRPRQSPKKGSSDD